MKLKNKSILLVSPEPFNHIYVSKHHYAINLAKCDNRVFFLNPPTQSSRCEKTKVNGIFSVDYKGFVKGLWILPSYLQRFFIRRGFFKLEAVCETKFDIIWSFDNSVFFDFSALPDDIVKINHLVDFNQDFNFKRAAITADICFSPNSFVLKKLAKYNSKTYFINHGVDIEDIDNKTVELPGKNAIKAVCAGNLDLLYFDWNLFKVLVHQNNGVDFILAGPWQNKTVGSVFPSSSNVFYLGTLEKQKLKDIYRSADILLICYKSDEYPEQLANPHKMMEYLFSGKSICASFTSEYRALSNENIISMGKQRCDLPKLFSELVSNLDFYNSEEKQLQRKSIAAENSYEKQIRRIEQYLS